MDGGKKKPIKVPALAQKKRKAKDASNPTPKKRMTRSQTQANNTPAPTDISPATTSPDTTSAATAPDASFDTDTQAINKADPIDIPLPSLLAVPTPVNAFIQVNIDSYIEDCRWFPQYSGIYNHEVDDAVWQPRLLAAALNVIGVINQVSDFRRGKLTMKSIIHAYLSFW